MTLDALAQPDPDPFGDAPGQRRTLFSALGVTAVAAAPVWLIGGLAVQIRQELGFGEARLGLLVTIFFSMSSLVSVPGGRVVERIGWRRGIAIASVLATAALLLVAAVAKSWLHLALAVGVAGLGNAIAQPAANLGLAQVIRSGRQGLAFGIKQAAIPLATLASGTAVPVIALTVGWRWAFAAAAVAALGIGLSTPSGHAALPPFRRKGTREGDAALLPLVILAAAGGMGSIVGTSFGAFIVDSSVTAGVAPGAAGLLLALGSLCGVSARVGYGWLADRWEGSLLTAVACLMTVGGAGLLLMPSQSTFATLLPLTGIVFATGWAWPGLFAFAIVRLNRNAPAAATGICLTGIYLGGVVGPLAFGLTVEHVGYAAAWFGTAFALFLGAALIVVVKIIMRRQTTEMGAIRDGGRG